MNANDAKKQLEQAGYICEWLFEGKKNIANTLVAKVDDTIAMALDITNANVDDRHMQWLLSDAMQKKAKRGNRGKI